MKKIGITGQNGFVGNHLYNTLGLFPGKYERVDFRNDFFDQQNGLDSFVRECDVIVHLAAINRHEDENELYKQNIALSEKLVESLKRTQSKAHVLISSSTQEERNNLYGKSKREARESIVNWAEQFGGKVTGLIIPNVFGAFGKPFYNSFIATFCYQLTHDEQPSIANDGEVKLIYVQELVDLILTEIDQEISKPILDIKHTTTKKVSEVLSILTYYKESYLEKGVIPNFNSKFELDLFNTYRSFIDYKSHFPIKFNLNTDQRGTFVEIIRMGIGGQSSYSTTVPGITRGNHFHTRKIERFAVIKGEAIIQLRKIGTNDVIDLYLNGNAPAYVDMPIWYTHNIKNIGEEELITMFWINEPYNEANPDTYFVEV